MADASGSAGRDETRTSGTRQEMTFKDGGGPGRGRGLTYVGHVQAVLLGGVVPGGGDGRHVHAVDPPHGGVSAIEVAAVGPRRLVVRTLLLGPLAADRKRGRNPSTCARDHVTTGGRPPRVFPSSVTSPFFFPDRIFEL